MGCRFSGFDGGPDNDGFALFRLAWRIQPTTNPTKARNHATRPIISPRRSETNRTGQIASITKDTTNRPMMVPTSTTNAYRNAVFMGLTRIRSNFAVYFQTWL